MNADEISRRERELADLDRRIAVHRASRPSWPLWVFVASLVLALISLRY